MTEEQEILNREPPISWSATGGTKESSEARVAGPECARLLMARYRAFNRDRRCPE